MFRLVVLISGNGSNLKNIIENIHSGYLNCQVVCVISNNKQAKGLEIAQTAKIPTYTISEKFKLSDNILTILESYSPNLVVCAGFLSILTGKFLETYQHRIINIHPSLLPSFGGKGMYGMKVHKAVIDAGVKITGCTAHFVTSEVDAGPIISQYPVNVEPEDLPETIASKVLEVEHKMLVKTIRLFVEDKIFIRKNQVRFKSLDTP